MKLKSLLQGMTLLAALMIAQTASAATAYYVNATDIYVRSHAGGYAMGRIYRDQRMDIQYIDSNGWAYGYAYGYVNRCVWAQYQENGNVRFWTHGTAVSNKCRTTNMYLDHPEFTNGEIWGTNDGVMIRIARDTHMWDNWAWGQAWGNHNYRGVSPAGSYWKIRYTTNDGAGVMARPCNATATECYSDWMFIQRSAF